MQTDDEEVKRDVDDFDKAVNELKFETRGNPTNRLKTESELAKIEKDKLDKLEVSEQALRSPCGSGLMSSGDKPQTMHHCRKRDWRG